MRFPRSCGILLHPTSLPGPYGCGDFGPEADNFIDFLVDSGMKLWQVLPLNPTGYADSPYQCLSAFAGNPLLISLDRLCERGLLHREELTRVPAFPRTNVDFGKVLAHRMPLLRMAAERFFAEATAEQRREYEGFCTANAVWLNDYALFAAAKSAHGGVTWTRWEPALAARQPEAIAFWSERLRDDIAAQRFWQFEFFRQWSALRERCRRKGIRLMGDLPIYVAHDSADVWANPQLFWLDAHGEPTRVAGVPPDYFSATGQLWGNPIYRWDRLQADGFQWWIARMRGVLSMFDMVRLDHFRGFEAYFEIPAGEHTAVNGQWVKGPGAAIFEAMQSALGPLPIAAENLGVITPEVEAIRNQFEFPGMALLQFAFGTDPQGPDFRPHNYPRNLVAYTGGHDNDTTVGWWTSGVGNSTRSEDDLRREHEFAQSYLNFGPGDEVNWVLIRAVMASVADTVLVPMQDVLGLGTEARMNLPGRPWGNWMFRYSAEQLKPEFAVRLKKLAALYDR